MVGGYLGTYMTTSGINAPQITRCCGVHRWNLFIPNLIRHRIVLLGDFLTVGSQNSYDLTLYQYLPIIFSK